MRATGRPSYLATFERLLHLYDTRGIKRLHLDAKIPESGGEQGDDRDQRQGEADDAEGRLHRRTADGFVEHKTVKNQSHRHTEAEDDESRPFADGLPTQVAPNGSHDGGVDIRDRGLALGAFA